MERSPQPEMIVSDTADYRENYANNVQVYLSVWNFFLVFGTMRPKGESVELRNYQGIYLSPQQGKALASLLQKYVANYELAFGEINIELEPAGPVN